MNAALRTAAQLAQAGRANEAIECLERALAVTRSTAPRPSNTIVAANMAGLLCVEAGRLTDAERFYREAATMADRDALPTLALADVLWRLGRFEEARSSLATAEIIARSVGDADALEIMARTTVRWHGGTP